MPTVNYSYSGAFDPATYRPVFDPAGTLAANRVSGEKHTLTAANGRDFHFIVPLFAPFFGGSAAPSIVFQGVSGDPRVLIEGIDYYLAFQFIGASRGCGKPVYGGISFLNTTLTGVLTLSYQCLGGNWCINLPEINRILADAVVNPRVVAWEQVVDRPTLFPVIDHEWNLHDLVGATEVVDAIEAIASAIAANPAVDPVGLNAHIAETDNPHRVTKQQLSLGNVQNFGVATPAEALAGVATNKYMTPALTKALVDEQTGGQDNLAETHILDITNPHQVTKAQVGLGNVQNFGVATSAEALVGSAANKYMTPALTKAIVAQSAAEQESLVEDHATDITNPHQVTKAQVGLGSVQNYAVATSAEALAGEATNKYMTPALTKVLVDSAVPDATATVKGKSKLNLGGQLNDATDTTKALTAAGLTALLTDAAANQLKNAVLSASYRVVLESSDMDMAQDNGLTKGSLVVVSSGTGTTALAGLSFLSNGGSRGLKMGLRSDGYFGIGGWTSAPWLWYTDPSGNTTSAGDVTAYSDPRLKENIEPILDATEKVKRLNGVYFTWKNIAHVACKAGKRDLGILADQVEAVFPEIVYPSISINGAIYKTVAYDKLIPVLLQAIKELALRCDKLEQRS